MDLMKNRVVVVGIDGATFKIINPLIAEGRLPNISKIIQNGVHAVLNSTIPPVSPVAWTSFMTGKNPHKHQIFDFTGKVNGSYRFKANSAVDRKAAPFWMNLSGSKKRSFVLGVTMTYPPDPLAGYMISGLGTPVEADLKSYTHPPDFAAEIERKFGKYRVVPDAKFRKLKRSDREKDKYIKGVFQQIDYRIRLFKYMWAKEKFDFSMIFFLDTDGISHYFWKYMDSRHQNFVRNEYTDAIYRIYEKIDSAIGELLAIIKADSDLIIVSDHGFGPLNRVIFLNNFLESKGYLKFRKTSPFHCAASRLKGILSKTQKSAMKEIEWRATKAYFAGTVGNIYLNLKGRDPEGFVSDSDYDQVCNELTTELLGLVDPKTGETVIQQVYKGKELYRLSRIKNEPDLIVTFKSGYSAVGEELPLHGLKDTGKIISDSDNWSGTHESDGIFIAFGKVFKKGYQRREANIIDVAPTIQYLLGVPISKSMDGKVLSDIFETAFSQSISPHYVDDDDAGGVDSEDISDHAEDDHKLIERLRDLGYLE